MISSRSKKIQMRRWLESNFAWEIYSINRCLVWIVMMTLKEREPWEVESRMVRYLIMVQIRYLEDLLKIDRVKVSYSCRERKNSKSKMALSTLLRMTKFWKWKTSSMRQLRQNYKICNKKSQSFKNSPKADMKGLNYKILFIQWLIKLRTSQR